MENAIFEEKKVSKAYMKLSLPLVLSMTVSLIYNLADTFFVAQTQNTNIVAGVSLCAATFSGRAAALSFRVCSAKTIQLPRGA